MLDAINAINNYRENRGGVEEGTGKRAASPNSAETYRFPDFTRNTRDLDEFPRLSLRLFGGRASDLTSGKAKFVATIGSGNSFRGDSRRE